MPRLLPESFPPSHAYQYACVLPCSHEPPCSHLLMVIGVRSMIAGSAKINLQKQFDGFAGSLALPPRSFCLGCVSRPDLLVRWSAPPCNGSSGHACAPTLPTGVFATRRRAHELAAHWHAQPCSPPMYERPIVCSHCSGLRVRFSFPTSDHGVLSTGMES